MKKPKGRSLAVLMAILLVISVSIGMTVAYFSDYEPAAGEAVIDLGEETTIDEGNSDARKEIVIKNTGTTNAVVRIAVYGPDQMKPITLPADWEKHGDFFYYKKVLAPGEDTGEAVIAELKELSKEDKAMLGDTFSITVIQESAIPTYDDNDNVVKPAGWDYIPTIKAPAVSYGN